MTTTINIPETTAQLTELIYRVQAGEEILLAQNGVAIAQLVPIPILFGVMSLTQTANSLPVAPLAAVLH